MSIFKIKIDCTDDNQLLYNNRPIKNKTKITNISNINFITKCSIIYRKIYNRTGPYTLKSLEFEINKSLNINELREFINNLKTLNFTSQKGTTTTLINITDNNSHKYIYKINFNTLNELPLIQKGKKRESSYKQIVIFNI
jgi:hypothetical protein